MAAPYHGLYTNHFANIRCSRPTFLGFWEQSAQTETYFNYGLLPRRNIKKVSPVGVPVPKA